MPDVNINVRANGIGAAHNGFQTIKNDLVQLKSATAGADAEVQKLEKDMNRAGASQGLPALFRGLAALAIPTVIAKIGYSFDAMKEQALVAFTTTLQSAEQAKALLSELERFAAGTPFEFPDLITAAKKLTSVGVAASNVIPIMRVLGDATAAMGTGAAGIDRAALALQQMANKGKVTGEEMLQLIEAGIPAWDALAAVLNVDVAKAQEMVEKRQVSVNKIYEAIQTSAGPALQRITGMMQQQSQTAQGLFSTIKDTFAQGAGLVFGPFFDRIKTGMQELARIMQDPATIAAIQSVAQAIDKMLTAFLKFLEPIKPFIPELAAFAAVLTGGVAVALGVVGAQAVIAFAALNALTLGIPVLVAGIAAAAALIIRNWDKVAAIFEDIKGVFNSLPGPVRAVIDFIVEQLGTKLALAVTGVVSIFKYLRDIFKAIWAAIHGDWDEAWKNLQSAAGHLAKGVAFAIMGAFLPLPKLILEVIDQVAGVVVGGINRIIGALEGSVGKIPGVGGLIPGKIEGGIDLSGLIPDIDWQAEFSGMLGLAQGILNVGDAATKTTDSLIEGENAFAGVGAAAESAAKTALNAFSSLVSSIQGLVFGRPTREEAGAQLQLADIDRRIAEEIARSGRSSSRLRLDRDTNKLVREDVPNRALEALERQREKIQNNISVMDAQNKVQQALLILADETLLSEKEQSEALKIGIDMIKGFSSKIAETKTQIGNELVPGFAAVTTAANDLAKALSTLTGGLIGVPSFAHGTDYVPRTGIALIHQGEQVIPAGRDGSRSLQVYDNVYVGGPSAAGRQSLDVLLQRLGG